MKIGKLIKSIDIHGERFDFYSIKFGILYYRPCCVIWTFNNMRDALNWAYECAAYMRTMGK